jgi:hypothetical protein
MGDYMEIKTRESVSLEKRNSLEAKTVEIILLRVIFVFGVLVTIIFSYALFQNVKLHLACSSVKCLYSTSTSITPDEYNNLVDKIDSKGYTLSYIVKNESKIKSEKSGKIDSTVPLTSGDKLILIFTHKADNDIENTIMFKEYLDADIK